MSIAEEVEAEHGHGDGGPGEVEHPPRDPDETLGVVDLVVEADHVWVPQPKEA